METAWCVGETYCLHLQVHIPEGGILYFDRSECPSSQGKG